MKFLGLEYVPVVCNISYLRCERTDPQVSLVFFQPARLPATFHQPCANHHMLSRGTLVLALAVLGRVSAMPQGISKTQSDIMARPLVSLDDEMAVFAQTVLGRVSTMPQVIPKTQRHIMARRSVNANHGSAVSQICPCNVLMGYLAILIQIRSNRFIQC